ncbi:MAG TPA: R3H domain-containing nucleic acid-binding protein [Anaeromyxobacteraceae bacterium]|nr:R3H domain-containing nucleic acid-binding protein [Anaeromyxobacteraceae bacterium]
MTENQAPPPPREAPEKARRASAFCQELLRRMGAKVEVVGRETPEAIGLSLTPAEGNEVELGPQLLEALQYLVNRVVNPTAEGRKWVNLDVGGFSEDADPVVKAMAARVAEAARRTGKVLAIAPISARERRQIHMALVGTEGVSTRSEGEGIFRHLLIVPSGGPARGGGAPGG